MYFRGIRFRTVQQKIRQPTRETLFRCSQQSHCRLRTTSSVQAPLSTIAQRDDDDIDEDVQRFATYCMREIWSRDDNFRSPGNEFSNPDVWNKPVEELLEESTSDLPKIPESQIVPEEMLSKFDPENPPSNLEDLQYWLECESQQESVQKYQNILQAARDRSDYSSLGMVQKLVVEWYQPLRDEIEREQMRYLAGPRRKTMNAYGPYLLCLPAEKLSVILAHESILHCCGPQNTGNGVTLGSLASRIGVAIEAELTVQQLLQKRLQEGKNERNVSEEPNDDDTAEKGNDDVEIETWMYGANHLEQFMEEISKKNKRVRLGTAIYHARRLLDSNEEWDAAKKVQVGAALLHVLLEKATVKNSNGKRERAFAHNKVYLSNKQVGFVKMHQDVYNSIAKDGHNSTMPISSRQKPMVVPPKKWVNPRKGAYKWLKSQLMRTDGSKLQEVIIKCECSIVRL